LTLFEKWKLSSNNKKSNYFQFNKVSETKLIKLIHLILFF